jgi:MinD-like ATPase involved in chromosome partitioning or flagellar assembly
VALITLVSAKGSPGVTTTALMLAAVWRRRVLVAECDPAGGDVTAGYFGGAAEPAGGVLAVASKLRRGIDAEDFFAHALPLDQARQRWVLPGFNDPAQAAGLAAQWGAFAEGCEVLNRQGIDVIADCGRMQAAHPPMELVRRADAVGLVVRPTLVGLRASYQWVAALRAEMAEAARRHPRLQLIVVGEMGAIGSVNLARLLDIPLAGVVTWDPRCAKYFSDGQQPPRGLWRSAPLRDIRVVADRFDQATVLVRARPRGPDTPHPQAAGAAYRER